MSTSQSLKSGLTKSIFNYPICGLYYKHMRIVNYTSSVVNKLKALLTDDARVIIYDRHQLTLGCMMFDQLTFGCMMFDQLFFTFGCMMFH